MRILTKTIYLTISLAALICVVGFSADMVTLTKVNFREQDDRVLIEFKATGRLNYRVKEYDAPAHLLIQFYNVKSGLPYKELDVNKGNVRSVSFKEVEVNAQTATFASIHLNSMINYDFDLSADGTTFQLYASNRRSEAQTAYTPSEPGYSGQETLPSLPEIKIPGDKQGTYQIPYSPTAAQGELVVPPRIKELDVSPYIVGPVILQDADISQTVRLLSEAAGGANIVVEAALVQQQSSATGGQVSGSAGGITVTLSHITLEDALDIITSSNNWSWRKYGDYYAIMTKDTALEGVKSAKSATVFEDTASRTSVILMHPKYSYACILASQLTTVITDTGCDASTNMLILRGIDRDLNRAREMIAALDVPTKQITKDSSQVTKIIRLKYIQIDDDFEKELVKIVGNPYFGGLVIGGDTRLGSVNTCSLDTHSNSVVFVGESEIYERFFNLIQTLDVPEKAVVIRTIPLKYISVRDLMGSTNESYIEPLEALVKRAGGSQNEQLIFSEPTNTVTYIGSETGYERVSGLIRSFDIEDRQYITKVIRLKYPHVLEIELKEFLDTLAELPGFGSDKKNAMTKFDYDPQTNSVVISTQKQYMDRLVDLIKSMDTSVFDSYTLEKFDIKYSYVIRVIQIVGELLTGTESEEVDYPDGSFFGENLDKWKWHAGEFYKFGKGGYPQTYKWWMAPDTAQNALIVLARPQEMEMIKKIIENVDRPYPQVKVDVQIVELLQTHNDRYELAYQSADGKIINGGNIPGTFGGLEISGDGVFFIYDTTADYVASFAASLQKAVTKVNGRIIASPSMIAPEGKTVMFDFTDKYPYSVYTEGVFFSDTESEEAKEGFYLSISPHFKDDYVLLSIYLNSSQITGKTEQNLPIQGDRIIQSEVKCKSGTPIILGGMVKSKESLTSVSLPYVSKLPVIGSLFKRKIKEQTDSEIVIVITPTILEFE